jgi:hypothetical protein
VDSKSKCCREYIKHSFKYNIEGPSVSDWASLEHTEDKVSYKLVQTTSELYKLLVQQSCFIKQQGFLKTWAKEMLCCSLDLLDKLKAQEEKEKIERAEEDIASTTIYLAATAAEQPNNLPGLSSEELLVFESSLWGLIAGSNEIPPVSQGS